MTASARYIARGRFLAGSGRSPPVKLMTAKPRKAKKVSATLETMSTAGGYVDGASRLGSIWRKVTTMKTANTASRMTTIQVWILSMKVAPAMLTAATATITADVSTWDQIGSASSPTSRLDA